MSGKQSSPGRGGGSRGATDGGGSSLRRPAVYAARRLRREMSLPEVLLWQRLKRSPMGANFRKQHPIDPYVVDFYSPAAKLIVEIDGEAHNLGDRPERDKARDKFLKSRGYRVLRIPACEVLVNADAAAEAVVAIALSPLHQVPLGPPSSGRSVPRTELGLPGAIQPGDRPGEDL